MEVGITHPRSLIDVVLVRLAIFAGFSLTCVIGWAVIGLFLIGLASGLAVIAARPDLLSFISGVVGANIGTGIIGLALMGMISGFATMLVTGAFRLGAIEGIDY